jgi:hypothetical protein
MNEVDLYDAMAVDQYKICVYMVVQILVLQPVNISLCY